MNESTIHMAWSAGEALREFRTGVSLHSHTSHSKETLDFIPRFVAAVPGAGAMLRRYEARYRALHGQDINYFDAWWTPPLGPKEALELEQRQIESLNRQGLVSLSDHDNIEAPLLLRVLSDSRETPISVEWTVPWRGTVLHIGVHNMGPRQAVAKMEAMRRFTLEPQEAELRRLFEWLTEEKETLIVFNHPYWDEKGRGQAHHEAMVEEFIAHCRRWIHALELNGLRPWAENRRVMARAEELALPAISGGDRHTCEPNALINITRAETFGEFVEEIRSERLSTVMVMPQYREAMAGRILAGIGDVMRDNDDHTHGWRRWNDRVFYRRAEDGETAPLSAAFAAGREPFLIRAFLAGVRVMEHRQVRAAVRQILQPAQELSL
ncbi:MAG: hypothetical protein IPP47_14550 [Bryobacterales bacterium]|nr:hypothetical protein [Bryobacterales bacterium]